MASQQFISEMARTPLSDLAEVLVKYVREACAENQEEAAQALADAVYSVLPIDGEDEPPQLLRVADFLESVGDPPPALVPEFLPAKKLICMSGAAKQGKSLIGLEFLHSISIGGKLMGQFPVKHPGTVVYFGMEDGGPEIKERLMMRGIIDLDNFYVCSQTFDMSTPQGFQTFKRLIDDLPETPSLVIIDTAREAFRVRDWNDAAIVGPAISPLRRWAQKNCTVVLITHNNKDKFASGVNQISGSGALVSSCDCFMILKNQKVLTNGDLRWDWEMAGRGLKPIKHVLEMDTNNLHVRALQGADIEAAAQEEKNEERREWYSRIALMTDDADDKQVTIRQISDALGIKYDFARSLVNEMVEQRSLRKLPTTRQEGAGRPSPLYDLTVKGAETYLVGGPAAVVASHSISPGTDT